MKYSVYISVEGEGLMSGDPLFLEFVQSIGGNVCERTRLGRAGEAAGACRFFWRSDVVSGSDRCAEDALNDYLAAIKIDLAMLLSKRSNINTSAHIVIYQGPGEESAGYFISAELIESLSEIKASLDIDVVCDLEG